MAPADAGPPPGTPTRDNSVHNSGSSSNGSTIIHCWSGPRCCSTSLMYSFAQRPDTKVLDEPLYAPYLLRTGINHPGRDEILAAYNTDGDAVLEEIQGYQGTAKPILYVKSIAKHKLACRNSVFDRDTHMLLVREPAAVIRSWAKVQEPTMQELGYTALLEIISELRSRGKRVVLVLSDELVREPEGTLRALCQALNIRFDAAMLTWAPGPKPYDGNWAQYWYHGTHKATGFASSVREALSSDPLPPHLRPLYHECSALYTLMAAQALRPLSAQVPRSPAQELRESYGGSPANALTTSASLSRSLSLGLGRASSKSLLAAAPTPALGSPGPDLASATPSAPGVADAAATTASAPPAAAAAAAAVAAGCESGTHSHAHDPRNADILIGIRDSVTGSYDLVWRPAAKVSVLDSGYMLGDGVWEGLRLHRGVLMKVTEHFDRLWEGAKAIDMDIGLTRQELQDMVYRAVDANGMSTASGVHVRLMVTRGLKPTPYQSPYITIGQPTIVIIPEWKEALPGVARQGLALFTCHVRRGAPDVQDPNWNSHSKLNCIAACIQAKKAGVDEALMLDPHGFVATCNSTNFFIVRKGEVWAPTTKYQMPGITRGSVLKLCAQLGIPARELDFSLTQVYSADEVFVTGTFAGITPVRMVDGRPIGQQGGQGDIQNRPITQRLHAALQAMYDQQASAGRSAVP